MVLIEELESDYMPGSSRSKKRKVIIESSGNQEVEEITEIFTHLEIRTSPPEPRFCQMCLSRKYDNSSYIRSQYWVKSRRLIKMILQKKVRHMFINYHLSEEFRSYFYVPPRRIDELNKRELGQAFHVALKFGIPLVKTGCNYHYECDGLLTFYLPKILDDIFGKPKVTRVVNECQPYSTLCHQHKCPTCRRSKSSRHNYCASCKKVNPKSLALTYHKKRTLEEMLAGLTI